MESIQKQIVVLQEHEHAIEEEALNLSKYVRKSLQTDYPKYFKEEE